MSAIETAKILKIISRILGNFRKKILVLNSSHNHASSKELNYMNFYAQGTKNYWTKIWLDPDMNKQIEKYNSLTGKAILKGFSQFEIKFVGCENMHMTSFFLFIY